MSIWGAKAFISNYGVPLAPLQTIDIPEQGPSLILPPRSRSLVPFNTFSSPFGPVTSSNYGVPLAPLEAIDLPEQGPGILLPQKELPGLAQAQLQVQHSRGFFLPVSEAQIQAQGYGVPIAPLEAIDLPEQGPGVLLPQEELPGLAQEAQLPVQHSRGQIQAQGLLYQYEVQDPYSIKQESRHVNGLTTGFYSYVDPEGRVQRTDYVADPVQGYRVLNAPVVQDTPEVARAKAEFFKAYQAALEMNKV